MNPECSDNALYPKAGRANCRRSCSVRIEGQICLWWGVVWFPIVRSRRRTVIVARCEYVAQPMRLLGEALRLLHLRGEPDEISWLIAECIGTDTISPLRGSRVVEHGK